MPTRSEVRSFLDTLDPYKFETVVAEIWDHKFGYETDVTAGSQDRGIDIVAVQDEPLKQKVLIQAKLYQEGNTIGSREIREYATLYQQDEDADRVALVSTGGFTTQAQALADDLQVDLFGREEIVRWLADDDIAAQLPYDIERIHGSTQVSDAPAPDQSSGDDGSVVDAVQRWESGEFVDAIALPESKTALVEGPITADALYNAMCFHVGIIVGEYGKNEHDTSEIVHLTFDEYTEPPFANVGIHYLEGLYQLVATNQGRIEQMDAISESLDQITKIHEEDVEERIIATYGHVDPSATLDPDEEFRTIVRIIADVFEAESADLASIRIESETPIRKAAELVFD